MSDETRRDPDAVEGAPEATTPEEAVEPAGANQVTPPDAADAGGDAAEPGEAETVTVDPEPDLVAETREPDEVVAETAPAGDGIEIIDTTGEAAATGPAAEAGEDNIIVVHATGGDAAGDDAIDDGRFRWHPEHAGKTAAEVRSELAHEIRADQRQHSLAMDGAEEAEHDALASVVSLERRWGQYDFDWAAQDPEALADRIVAFEQERERRQEMISWADYRAEGYEADGAGGGDTAAPELGTGTKALSLALVVALILLILISVWLL